MVRTRAVRSLKIIRAELIRIISYPNKNRIYQSEEIVFLILNNKIEIPIKITIQQEETGNKETITMAIELIAIIVARITNLEENVVAEEDTTATTETTITAIITDTTMIKESKAKKSYKPTSQVLNKALTRTLISIRKHILMSLIETIHIAMTAIETAAKDKGEGILMNRIQDIGRSKLSFSLSRK